MKRIKIELGVDPEIFAAAKQFMNAKGLKIEDSLDNSVMKFYKKYVPSDVRKYIESRVSAARPSLKKSVDSKASSSTLQVMEGPISGSESGKSIPN